MYHPGLLDFEVCFEEYLLIFYFTYFVSDKVLVALNTIHSFILIYIKSLKDKRKIIKIISKSISFTNYDSQFLMG